MTVRQRDAEHREGSISKAVRRFRMLIRKRTGYKLPKGASSVRTLADIAWKHGPYMWPMAHITRIAQT